MTSMSSMPSQDTNTVEPTADQSHTLILLDEPDANGEKFEKELVKTGVTCSGQRLADLIPEARFVSPTSKRRRSSGFSRAVTT